MQPVSLVPKSDSVTPPEPDWATLYDDDLHIRYVRDQWRLIVGALRDMGTLTVERGSVIKRLCMFRLEVERCSEMVAKGTTVRKHYQQVQISPYWTSMKQAHKEAVDLEKLLGLIGKSAKVKKKDAVKEKASSEFLRSVR